MGALVILRLPRVDERSEERHVRQSRTRRDGSGFAVHVRLIRVVEVVVFIRQPAGKHCSIIGFPDDIARGCIPLGSQFHVGIDHLGAPHHIEATGIACREFCCIVLFHGAGLAFGSALVAEIYPPSVTVMESCCASSWMAESSSFVQAASNKSNATCRRWYMSCIFMFLFLMDKWIRHVNRSECEYRAYPVAHELVVFRIFARLAIRVYVPGDFRLAVVLRTRPAFGNP